MIYIRKKKEDDTLFQLKEMATTCHPKDKGGRYPMWIRVEYTNGEHRPPHAHLYPSVQRPLPNTLVTKFLITENPPTAQTIQVMKGKPEVPSAYAKMIEDWAKESNELGINNWLSLRNDWLNLERTLKK